MLTVGGCLQALLREYAPFCLKQYFDKDARKPFCQPHLWTEPYNNLMARLSAQSQQDGGMLATTAAVVQALLVSTGLTGQEEEGASGGGARPASAASAHIGGSSSSSVPRGPHLPGLRTSALLSLLKAAPQCVPFTVRLELFRQMMEQDKVCGLCWGGADSTVWRGHHLRRAHVLLRHICDWRVLRADAVRQSTCVGGCSLLHAIDLCCHSHAGAGTCRLLRVGRGPSS